MESPVSSGTESEKRHTRAQRIWVFLVILAAIAVVFVIAYPLVSTLINRRYTVPSLEDTTVTVSDSIASLPPEQRAEMARRLFRSPNPLIRLAVVEAIEDWKIREALDLLERSLEDNCSAVRRRGMETLWKQDRQRGMQLILAALRDMDVDLRRGAISQVRFANEPRVVPAVIPLLDDPDPTIRFFATGVLRKLTGMPYLARNTDSEQRKQEVVQLWKRWWQQNQHRWKQTEQWAKVPPVAPTRTDPASPFTLKALDGKRLRLSDLKGKIVVLHFYATWCAPCEQEMPHLVRLSQNYPPDQVAVIGLAVNETDNGQTVREWTRRFGITYPQALAPPAVVAAYWVQGVPITYLIDTQGRIRYRFEGERDFESYRQMVEYLLQESNATSSPPRPESGR